MKRFISVLLITTFTAVLWAQSLSDQEVIKIALSYKEQGLSTTDMAKELVRRGATVEQLQRLQKEWQQAAADNAQSSDKNNRNSTLREDNGETFDRAGMNEQLSEKASSIYGHDIFRRAGKGFSPSMNQATPQNYTLGAGDEVIIDIYGAGQLSVRNTISPDGTIIFEGYGPVHLGGLTIQEATRRLKNTIGTRYQGSQIMLSLGQTRSISVQVMGEVNMPGSYQLSAFANVFSALYAAGGITETGTLRSIRIYRNNQLANTADLYAYLTQGASSANERLNDGDIVVVGAYEELVTVSGKVKRPMSYEMRQGETIAALLQLAGGFSGDAYTAAVRVNRKNQGAMSVSTVRNEQFESFALMDGDSVAVDSILPRFQNTVAIQGAVFRPGQYGLSEELHTISQLIGMADGAMEEAYLERGVLYRMKLDRTYQAIPLDLEDILAGNAEDIELRNEDELFIPSKHEQLSRQYVVIHGEVFHPDTFAYAENERVEDLILRAGGLTERASTSKVDVSRRVIDPSATEESQIKSETFTVTIEQDMAITDKGFQLKPFDEVFVRQSPAFGKQMNVQVRGEILFEGTYTMKTQDDRLSDLVKAAGGITAHAHINGARLQRTITEEERIRRQQLLKMNKAASSKDSVNIEKLDLGNTYFVGIDLAAALKNPGSNEDIVLREGDVLIIPTQNTTVKINGEVLYPNTVSYISGKKARYYINQAGGYSNMARRSKAYVIYANGKVAPACSAKITPGCEIVVPSKPERQASNAAQWVSIASASASLASVAATITTLIINSSK